MGHSVIFNTPECLRPCHYPSRRLCRNSRKYYQYRHAGENRHPELFYATGFRVALRLHGMTHFNYDTICQLGNPVRIFP